MVCWWYLIKNWNQQCYYMSINANNMMVGSNTPDEKNDDMVFAFVPTDNSKIFIESYSGKRVYYQQNSGTQIAANKSGYPYYMVQGDGRVAFDFASASPPGQQETTMRGGFCKKFRKKRL